MRAKKIFWGLALIFIATFLILSAADIIPAFDTFAGEISWWVALICLVLLAYSITKIIELNIGGIFIPLALIFMLLEKNIAIICGRAEGNIINNWLLLICAIMLKIGWAILFRKKKSKHRHRFSDSVEYVDLQSSGSKYYSNELGELVIRFDNIEQHTGEKTIHVSNRLGETVIEVPSSWYCVCNIKNKLGEVSMKKNIADADAPRLIIEGHNELGETSVKFV